MYTLDLDEIILMIEFFENQYFYDDEENERKEAIKKYLESNNVSKLNWMFPLFKKLTSSKTTITGLDAETQTILNRIRKEYA